DVLTFTDQQATVHGPYGLLAQKLGLGVLRPGEARRAS
ncbi:hypothetical protein A2U01_0077291, partial [Trifolium medium]|nr:hypothetical protein [Trifolium medium]